MSSSLKAGPYAMPGGPRAVWTAGDFGRVARYTETEGRDFVSRLPIREGALVLDVGCGTGNLALEAARRGARVWGLDIAPNLIGQARARALGEGLLVEFDEGDAEELPYADASFDLVMSMYGAMFAPRQEKVAAELARVCRPGGLIAMANWTPSGFIGRMLKLVAGRLGAPAGARSPASWGEEDTVRERFGGGVSGLRMTRRVHDLKFPFDPRATVEFFIRYYGPTLRAFESLGPEGCEELRADLERLWSADNRAADGSTHVRAEYLEVLARRAGQKVRPRKMPSQLLPRPRLPKL